MVEKHQLLPLWFMLNVSADATVGATLHSDVTITLATSSPQNNKATPTTLHGTVDIVVEAAPVPTDSGDSEAGGDTRRGEAGHTVESSTVNHILGGRVDVAREGLKRRERRGVGCRAVDTLP